MCLKSSPAVSANSRTRRLPISTCSFLPAIAPTLYPRPPGLSNSGSIPCLMGVLGVFDHIDLEKVLLGRAPNVLLMVFSKATKTAHRTTVRFAPSRRPFIDTIPSNRRDHDSSLGCSCRAPFPAPSHPPSLVPARHLLLWPSRCSACVPRSGQATALYRPRRRLLPSGVHPPSN